MMLRYKQFSAQYQWAPMPGLYVAEIMQTPEVLSFSATSLEELKWLMMVTVEQYLCQLKSVFEQTSEST